MSACRRKACVQGEDSGLALYIYIINLYCRRINFASCGYFGCGRLQDSSRFLTHVSAVKICVTAECSKRALQRLVVWWDAAPFAVRQAAAPISSISSDHFRDSRANLNLTSIIVPLVPISVNNCTNVFQLRGSSSCISRLLIACKQLSRRGREPLAAGSNALSRTLQHTHAAIFFSTSQHNVT